MAFLALPTQDAAQEIYGMDEQDEMETGNPGEAESDQYESQFESVADSEQDISDQVIERYLRRRVMGHGTSYPRNAGSVFTVAGKPRFKRTIGNQTRKSQVKPLVRIGGKQQPIIPTLAQTAELLAHQTSMTPVKAVVDPTTP